MARLRVARRRLAGICSAIINRDFVNRDRRGLNKDGGEQKGHGGAPDDDQPLKPACPFLPAQGKGYAWEAEKLKPVSRHPGRRSGSGNAIVQDLGHSRRRLDGAALTAWALRVYPSARDGSPARERRGNPVRRRSAKSGAVPATVSSKPAPYATGQPGRRRKQGDDLRARRPADAVARSRCGSTPAGRGTFRLKRRQWAREPGLARCAFVANGPFCSRRAANQRMVHDLFQAP